MGCTLDNKEYVIRTYTYKIRHQERYEEAFERMLSLCRYVYNLAKETKEESYRCGLNLSNYDLQKQFTQCKKEDGFEWLYDLSSGTAKVVIERMDNSFKRFFKGAGYPKWASKHKWSSVPFVQNSATVTNPLGCLKQTDKGFRLPKIGEVKVFQSYRRIQGQIRTASIVKKADGYYLHVQVKSEPIIKEIIESQDIAIDLGLTHFAALSDGSFIENPRINERTESKLTVLNRKLSRAKKGSNGRKKVVNQIQRLCLKRSRQRKDFLHKITSDLANKHSVVYLEDLKVSKMVQDKRYSKGISDVGWGYFKELLSYKTNVIKVNPAYTSQTCSKCGHIDAESRKTQSEFKCTACGHQDNADYNATKEILKRGRADLKGAKVIQ